MKIQRKQNKGTYPKWRKDIDILDGVSDLQKSKELTHRVI
jgi:hypothetical protein